MVRGKRAEKQPEPKRPEPESLDTTQAAAPETATNGVHNEDPGTERLVLAADSLRGDLRDTILNEFKVAQKPWEKMTEDEQARLIHRANDAAGNIIRGAVILVAHQGAPHLVAKIGKFTVNEGIKIEVQVAETVENLVKLAGRAGSAVLVLADVHQFQGQRKETEPDNVGSLAIPKNGERKDEAALGEVGRGDGQATAADLPDMPQQQ